MWDRLELVTGPAIEPVTLAEAKAQCRVDTSDHDDLLQRLIKVARAKIEGRDGCGVFLVPQTWKVTLDQLTGEIRIPTGPVLSIDSITYTDPAESEQTLASNLYQWRKGLFEARIKPVFGSSWPMVAQQYSAATVTFTVGWPGADASPVSIAGIPEDLRHAVLMLVNQYFDHRDDLLPEKMQALPHGVNAIVEKYRVGRFG